jgi:arylsulfatase A-like enzyme
MKYSNITRRAFAAAAVSPLLAQPTQDRPNILWITCEDTGPHLGAYGDVYADTPNLDGLASRALRYTNAWSNAPVCAPARTTIISGLYPTSTGSEHMRSMTRLPDTFRMFPCYLRDAGYYTSNNVKEDYNLEHTGKVWDDSSQKAHWRNRKAGQPFFSVFNLIITHESQIRTRPHTFVHDPAKAPLPPYHPDTPEVRQDWAQYYDNITTMDGQAKSILDDLARDGLAENTIVFFYGDHGSGMPRSKRSPCNSGLQVPLLVHIPERYRSLAPADYKPGGTSERLVGFIDLAPTVLSLAGVRPPDYYQGHAFMGTHATREQPYLYGFRGRMDERHDLIRSVRDKQFVYVRNYMPHRIYGAHVAYMFQTPTTRVWKELYDQRKLRPPQTHFWERKPAEELYDLRSDRHEVHNLADAPEHQQVLKRLREAHRQFELSTCDVDLLPEDDMHVRAKNSTPYQVGHDRKNCPLGRVLEIAQLASAGRGNVAALLKALNDDDAAVRYWAATGLVIRGREAVLSNVAALRPKLQDKAPSVRTAAAEALATFTDGEDRKKAMAVLLELGNVKNHGYYVAVQALNAIDATEKNAAPYIDAIRNLPIEDLSIHERMKGHIRDLVQHIVSRVAANTSSRAAN